MNSRIVLIFLLFTYLTANENLNCISIVDNSNLSDFFQDDKNSGAYYYLNPINCSTETHTPSTNILTKSSQLCTRSPLSPQPSSNVNSNNQASEPLEQSANLVFDDLSSAFRKPPKTYKIPRSTSSLSSFNLVTSESDNLVKQGPFQRNPDSLFVELLIVYDNSQYVKYDRNTTLIAERTMQIVNIMNAYYRQLNIFIVLVGIVLWTEKDEIQLTEDGDATLTNFLKYSVVGKALKGPICTHEHSGGVNTGHTHNPAVVAATLAHELGHNFGMEHDEPDCKCPDEKCIMSSSTSSLVNPKHWSSCSVEYLAEAQSHGLLECLRNQPDKVYGPVCGNGLVEEGEDCDIGEPIPVLGSSSPKNRQNNNSRKCGPGTNCEHASNLAAAARQQLVNPCCDRRTCKFVANATCAQGPCCDLNKCSVYQAGLRMVCRPRLGECDIEELCDGVGESCPSDVYYHDGIECEPGKMGDLSATPLMAPASSLSSSSSSSPSTTITTSTSSTSYSADLNRSRAYCYQGKCASHHSQCQLLWGPSGSVSRDICYEQNVHGNTSGNCGYNRQERIYNSCDIEDAICGMMHCVHNQAGLGDSGRKTGKLAYGFESASILTVSFFVMALNNAKIYCHGAVIDAGPSVRDPGLVPNGASCGDERMCVNQRCVPVADIVYKNWCPSDCNGNGICDNLGVCHCNDGSSGTSCYQFFGANFHLSLLLYVVMFFAPLVALIVFAINHYKKQIKIWWFLHNRKIALREKGREQHMLSRNGIAAGPADRLTISEPIPLNQRNNVNRPFYDPPPAPEQLQLDPWAEPGGAQRFKPPPPTALGFRLEPLTNPAGQNQYNNNNNNNNNRQAAAQAGQQQPIVSVPGE